MSDFAQDTVTAPIPQTSPLGRHQRLRDIAFGISAATALITAVALGGIGSFVIPQFESVFRSFGADLPFATRILLELRDFLWLSLAIALGFTAIGLFCARRLLTGLLIALGILNLLGGGGCIVAMYLPIFKLGSSV